MVESRSNEHFSGTQPSHASQHSHHDHANCSGHDHGEHDHDHDHDDPNKAEKKIKKALNKLGMTKMEKVDRVTIKQKENYVLIVKSPEVYQVHSSENTYVIFGELSFDDEKQSAQDMLNNFRSEADNSHANESEKPKEKVDVVEDENAAVDETGIADDDIKIVMSQANVTRGQAVRALRNNDNDTVAAILEFNN